MVLKGGTDIEDLCMQNYTTKMKCKRWPMNAFCFILDAARCNSQSIYCKVMKKDVRQSNSYKFGMDLAKALIIPHIERREKDLTGQPKSIQHKMSLVLGRELKTAKKREAPIQIDQFESFVDQRRRCYMCINALPSEGYNKARSNISYSQTQCGTCGKAVCRKHLINVCQTCGRSFSTQTQEDPEVHREIDDWN